MPTDHEIANARHRQAYWLRLARAYDPRKPTLSEVAKAAGLSEGSGSVVSLWENDLTPEGPKPSRLRRVAGYYGLPVSFFIEPPETDEERLASLRRLAIAAVELALEDLEAEQDDDPDDEAPPGGSPGRRQA